MQEHKAIRRGRRGPLQYLAAGLFAWVVGLGFIGGASGQCEDNFSKLPSCSAQYAMDGAVCRRVKLRACWASRMERLAYCERHKGATGIPMLVTE